MNGAPWGRLLAKPLLIAGGVGLALGIATNLLPREAPPPREATPRKQEPTVATECTPIRMLSDGTFYGWRCEETTRSAEFYRPDPVLLERWLADKCAEGSAELA
jgi:hypothetical protein